MSYGAGEKPRQLKEMQLTEGWQDMLTDADVYISLVGAAARGLRDDHHNASI
jgi:hypothetical protein